MSLNANEKNKGNIENRISKQSKGRKENKDIKETQVIKAIKERKGKEEQLLKLLQTLHPLERAVLPFLKEDATLETILLSTSLKEVEAMRALQWLENKEIIRLKQEPKIIISLDENGKKYLKSGLPETHLLEFLEKEKTASIESLNSLDFSREELTACFGILKKKAAISLANTTITITSHGARLLTAPQSEELFLKSLPLAESELSDEQKYAYAELKKRKRIIKTEPFKKRTVEISPLGAELLALASSDKIKSILKNTIDSITPEIIKKEAWKTSSFRRFDIKINVPRITAGRKQHYRRFLDEVRKHFLAMGFTEMRAPLVETEFWNMDALFMPQFHSARDIHDVYYVKEPKFTSHLPQKLLKKVKFTHQKNWKYTFDEKRSHRHILRSQGTACSARMLASPFLKIPGKYFGITRCFRYDVIDATHNCDFYQTEGIVLAEKLNFSHLKGLLKMFAEEFANTTTIKIKPGYFPFTEPSAELMAKHPDLGWIELGGSGIFRPELTASFGITTPVIAWGLGIDRIGMFNMELKDIRHLFSHDLEVLRGIKFI